MSTGSGVIPDYSYQFRRLHRLPLRTRCGKEEWLVEDDVFLLSAARRRRGDPAPQAADLLRPEGLLRRTPRAGTTVAQAKFAHGLESLRGLAETLGGHGEVANEVRVA